MYSVSQVRIEHSQRNLDTAARTRVLRRSPFEAAPLAPALARWTPRSSRSYSLSA